MLKSNKGFTVIELIMSFVFSSILAISLFSIIVTYKNKQVDSSIEQELLAFKAHLVMDVQDDVQLKGVKEIETCKQIDNEGRETIEPRCIYITFNDNTKKVFRVDTEIKIDEIYDDNNEKIADYSYGVPYIIYGDIKYDIPDGANIFIDDDYILHTKSINDGIETRTKLYKIGFNLNHADLDTDIDISIVINGTQADPVPAGEYQQYSKGDRVSVQLNEKYQQAFRVIKDSSKTQADLILLYDPETKKDAACGNAGDPYVIYKRITDPSYIPNPRTIDLNSVEFNAIRNYANRYDGSIIKNVVYELGLEWNNADEVRLITTEEIARISSSCPQFRGVDSPNLSLATSPSWLTNKSYWTMSEKIVTGNNNGKLVWYVDSSSKSMLGSSVDAHYALRPVIVINKRYVTFKITDSVNICPYGMDH